MRKKFLAILALLTLCCALLSACGSSGVGNDNNDKKECPLADGTYTAVFKTDSGMFRVGSGDLIPGLDRGLVGAHLGQEALVVFSSENGYGNQQVGLVPENTALLFEVLVAAIKKN